MVRDVASIHPSRPHFVRAGARTAFTLIELLVVVAIITVLIAILIPSLGRARDLAKTVRCASNMKQIYTATVIYGTENADTMLPARVYAGSSLDFLWCGNQQLAPVFNIRWDPNASQTERNNVALKVSAMMHCPSVDHSWITFDPTMPLTNVPWYYDYQYNQNLGYNTATEGTAPVFQQNGSDSSGNPILMTCVKRTYIPRETVLLTDDRDQSTQHDYCFSKVSTLMPPSTADLSGQQGIPHASKTKANMLFADGQILLVDPKKMLPESTYNWIINFRVARASAFPF